MKCARASASLLALSSALLLSPANATAQQELFKLTASDAAPGDYFGRSVGISADRAIVGSPNHGASDIGSAYIFDVTSGNELFELFPSGGAAFGEFGVSVGISGDRAIVGARYDDGNGANSGSAYIFDVTTGQQLFKLVASDGASSDEFGCSVAISGPRAVVGARADDDNGVDSGSAYIFDVATGAQLFKMTPTDGTAGDLFGQSVAMCGGRAVIGAPLDDDNDPDSGSAYVFDVTTGQELFKLLASDGAFLDFFGGDVACDAGLALIGATGCDDYPDADSGAAYVFNLTTGQESSKLTASDASSGDTFGRGVAMSGARAVIAAPYDDDNGSASGSAYLFDATSGQELAKLIASDGDYLDLFGFGVAISGEHAIVGALQDEDAGQNAGSAYVFLTDVGSAYCFGDGSGSPCPCGNTGGAGEGCANSGGTGGQLMAFGSDSVAMDDLVLYGSHLPPSQPALLFAGANAVNGGNGAVFGDGLRCAGGSVARLGVGLPAANGYATWGPGLGAMGAWGAGDTRRFQAWYRDPGGPCGTGFNLTNGTEITFSS